MKSFAIAALIAAVAAESPDCPESTQVFSYSERAPAATGFVQVSACQSTGVAGVRCVPNDQLFATGMNGDEDLGQTIKMKGDTYKYNQAPEVSELFATGMNGDEDLQQTIKMKGDTYKYQQFATGMNGDEDLGQTIKMKGDTYKYNQE